MVVDHALILGGSLVFFEWVISGILIYIGFDLLDGITSSCTGFRFLGATFLIIGVILLILPFICFAVVTFMDLPDPSMAMKCGACCFGTLFVVATALAAFALAVSGEGGGTSVPGRSYKEYHVGSYSKWMQHKVNDGNNWESYYKKGVIKGDVCYKFSRDYKFDSLDDFHKRKLSPFESGCCKPPEDCNFDYIIPSIWLNPENETCPDINCNRWDNDSNTLCYDCQSCRAAFLQDVTSQYFGAGIVWVALLAKIIVVGAIVSCVWFGSTSSRGYTSLA